MSDKLELDLTEQQAVHLGCEKRAAYAQYKKALQDGRIELAISMASWNFCLDNQLMHAAPEDIQEKIRTGNEGPKP